MLNEARRQSVTITRDQPCNRSHRVDRSLRDASSGAMVQQPSQLRVEQSQLELPRPRQWAAILRVLEAPRLLGGDPGARFIQRLMSPIRLFQTVIGQGQEVPFPRRAAV